MTPGHARKPWWRSSRFFGLSVLAHVAFITFVARACDTPFTSGGFALTVPRNTGPMDVTLIEPTVLNPYVTRPTEILEMAEVEKKVEEARKQEENRDISGQVVDQAKPDVEIRPDDSAKFLSEYDNKVEKETRGGSATVRLAASSRARRWRWRAARRSRDRRSRRSRRSRPRRGRVGRRPRARWRCAAGPSPPRRRRAARTRG
jgi:hypothetical protein